jgi:hypothetical protein
VLYVEMRGRARVAQKKDGRRGIKGEGEGRGRERRGKGRKGPLSREGKEEENERGLLS